jgi:hypothetical protein
MDHLPRWPGYLLGAISGMALVLAGEVADHVLSTDVPALLADFDDAHDIDL